jgi:hypothetical protein
MNNFSSFEEIKYRGSKYFEMLALRQKVLREPLDLKLTSKDLAAEANHLF